METSKVIIAVVILLLLGGGAYFYFQNNENQMDDDDILVTQSAEPAASQAAMSADDITASGEGAMEDGVKAFTVNGSNFKFEPSTITVNKGDKVKITFKNTGGFHDFMIDEFEGAKTKQLGANASETIEFVADKAGSFEYYCSVGNHRGMGMKGTLTVK